jgi:hypothetical protein
MQKVSNGKQKMTVTWKGKSYRSFVRSFARSFVRLSSWRKENDNGGKKVMTRGRRSKSKGPKKFLLCSDAEFKMR